jgi:hypothetical protein
MRSPVCDNLTEEQRAALEKAIVPAGTHLDRVPDGIPVSRLNLGKNGVKFLF